MQHFEKHMLPEYHNRAHRDINARQVLKICYVCRKGFCKRKGREKAFPIANAPRRWGCLKCMKNPPAHILLLRPLKN
jgi:hypothetical protein